MKTIKMQLTIIDDIFNSVKDMEAKNEDILDNTNSISSASEEMLASSKRAILEYGVLI